MAETDSKFILLQVAVELRYDGGLLYYDKSGEVQKQLLSVLGPPFSASRLAEVGRAATISNVRSRVDNLDLNFSAERFSALHFGADNMARVEQVVPTAWDVVHAILELKKGVRRCGVRHWVIWPADSEDAAEKLLTKLGVFGETDRWPQVFGSSPKNRTFAGVVPDGSRQIRYSLSTGGVTVDGEVVESLKKFYVTHGLVLDVDHGQTYDPADGISRQQLKEWIRDSWTKTQMVARNIERLI